MAPARYLSAGLAPMLQIDQISMIGVTWSLVLREVEQAQCSRAAVPMRLVCVGVGRWHLSDIVRY